MSYSDTLMQNIKHLQKKKKKGTRIVNISCVLMLLNYLQDFEKFTGLRNRVVVDIYWNIWSPLVLKRSKDLLYTSFVNDETKKQSKNQ